MKFNVASLLVSEDCNLRCKYCFEEKRPGLMSPEVMKRSLEFLCEGAIESNVPSFGISLFGGEPTLNPAVCAQALDQGIYLGQKYNKRFEAGMITNSVILPSVLASAIREKGTAAHFNVQLSVDGLAEDQDAQRVFADGSGSFATVRKTIDQWLDVMRDLPDALSLHGCLTPATVGHLYNIWRYYRDEVGIKRLWFIPIPELMWKPEHVKMYHEQVGLIYEDILHRVRSSHSTSEVDAYAPLDRCLREWSRPGKACKAGYGYGTITSTGDLYPCHQIYYNDPTHDTRMGDIWKGVDPDVERIFKESDQADLGCSADCDAVHCYRCLAANWVYHGSMFSQMKGLYCLMMRSDAEYQKTLKKEIATMGIIGKKQGENGRPYSGTYQPGYDSGEACQCNVNQPSPAVDDAVLPASDTVSVLNQIVLQNNEILYELRRMNEKK